MKTRYTFPRLRRLLGYEWRSPMCASCRGPHNFNCEKCEAGIWVRKGTPYAQDRLGRLASSFATPAQVGRLSPQGTTVDDAKGSVLTVTLEFDPKTLRPLSLFQSWSGHMDSCGFTFVSYHPVTRTAAVCPKPAPSSFLADYSAKTGEWRTYTPMVWEAWYQEVYGEAFAGELEILKP